MRKGAACRWATLDAVRFVFVCATVRAPAGIAALPRFICQAELKAGALRPVLREWMTLAAGQGSLARSSRV
ncbi:hypothetical protein BZM27_18960 [Paraburkholderia steynii]|uniref:LysR family transcriptional regulator n=1 Tax=Paraburkholderia steynii TaxID=1245441 RepID=A0A4R0XAZ3_9BURK|nr:hypothetical protein BZM27_18960 [Paraburkholderia steynii]